MFAVIDSGKHSAHELIVISVTLMLSPGLNPITYTCSGHDCVIYCSFSLGLGLAGLCCIEVEALGLVIE